ncbi:MAG: hypothetical protein KF778_03340 [Rhodocyclaceae bacterium]|nr:hypothetical protein [Rhodocyclaceae bacterium]MBX3667412.1 hypothetical protein [Rhodocyclaceae bacterium]
MNKPAYPAALADTAADAETAMSGLLDWLAAPPPDDPEQDLPEVYVRLTELLAGGTQGNQLLRVLDLFFARAQHLAHDMRPRLAASYLPLPRALRQATARLGDIHHALADAYGRLAGDRSLSDRSHLSALTRALRSTLEHYLARAAMAAPPPPDFWVHAHALFAQVSTLDEAAAGHGEANQAYFALLALAVAQPESLAPRDLWQAAETLALHCGTLSLLQAAPTTEDGDDGYWIDRKRDHPPIPASRRAPPANADAAYFTLSAIAKTLTDELDALDAGKPIDSTRLPTSAVENDMRALLRRLCLRWVKPPKRALKRRHNNYRAQLCTGLAEVWQLLTAGNAPVNAAAPISEWMVENESANGFAAMHVGGEMTQLRPGAVAALRSPDSDAWAICLIRWLRSDNPEHMEVGLEMVAPKAQPVQVAFRSGKHDDIPVPALRLPPLAATRPREALITPRGTCVARRFVMIWQVGERICVSQGRMRGFDQQTANADLFQFDADPYPI